ncbi:hypothetical protein NBRC116188_02740 [Oceaniserpentilla sp. 4NH20-0058]|uniref:hypothetical protein n=1 Tax=Oceaniserpentilla sp. 4NH20-0058 TaxID=3127660 RepID=UPI00310979F9
MKTTDFIKKTSILSTLSLGLILSSASFASTGGGGGGGGGSTDSFDDLFSEAEDDGRCSVQRVERSDSTFYVPTDPTNSSAKFHILGWGNGTGGTENTYSTLLRSLASQCVLVAAANTDNSGTGEEIEDAVNDARSRYASKVLSNHKVCTSGHSQGGGGSFNAANRLDADCVIAIQADTRFTTTIYDDLASDVEVIALWSEDDTLAPAGSEYFTSNTRNVEAASSILTEAETANEDHFTITSGRGGDIGSMFRMAVKAQLSNDSAEATRFRGAFWGPSTSSTVTTSASEISEVERDSGAVNTQP